LKKTSSKPSVLIKELKKKDLLKHAEIGRSKSAGVENLSKKVLGVIEKDRIEGIKKKKKTEMGIGSTDR